MEGRGDGRVGGGAGSATMTLIAGSSHSSPQSQIRAVPIDTASVALWLRRLKSGRRTSRVV